MSDDFIHNDVLEEQAAGCHDLSDIIVDFFKLVLYPEQSAINNCAERVLARISGERAAENLVTEHLRAVIKDCKEAIFRDAQFQFSQVELQQAIENNSVRIMVPMIWTPNTRQNMQGINICVLASEPQCGLAYIIYK